MRLKVGGDLGMRLKVGGLGMRLKVGRGPGNEAKGGWGGLGMRLKVGGGPGNEATEIAPRLLLLQSKG